MQQLEKMTQIKLTILKKKILIARDNRQIFRLSMKKAFQIILKCFFYKKNHQENHQD